MTYMDSSVAAKEIRKESRDDRASVLALYFGL
jgi:hypothetical protein